MSACITRNESESIVFEMKCMKWKTPTRLAQGTRIYDWIKFSLTDKVTWFLIFKVDASVVRNQSIEVIEVKSVKSFNKSEAHKGKRKRKTKYQI